MANDGDAVANDNEILFTQYLLPDGRKVPVTIERPPDICELARKIIALGSRFECEMLRDMSTCSFTVTNPDNDEPDIAIRLAKNGPDVSTAVDLLVHDAARWHKIEVA